MDFKSIADQVMGAVGNCPDALKDFAADPRAAISDLTGAGLEGIDLGGAADQVAEQTAGCGFDLGSLGESLDLSALTENLPESLSGVAENLPEGLGSLAENLPEGLSGITENLGNVTENLPGGISDILGGIGGLFGRK